MDIKTNRHQTKHKHSPDNSQHHSFFARVNSLRRGLLRKKSTEKTFVTATVQPVQMSRSVSLPIKFNNKVFQVNDQEKSYQNIVKTRTLLHLSKQKSLPKLTTYKLNPEQANDFKTFKPQQEELKLPRSSQIVRAKSSEHLHKVGDSNKVMNIKDIASNNNTCSASDIHEGVCKHCNSVYSKVSKEHVYINNALRMIDNVLRSSEGDLYSNEGPLESINNALQSSSLPTDYTLYARVNKNRNNSNDEDEGYKNVGKHLLLGDKPCEKTTKEPFNPYADVKDKNFEIEDDNPYSEIKTLNRGAKPIDKSGGGNDIFFANDDDDWKYESIKSLHKKLTDSVKSGNYTAPKSSFKTHNKIESDYQEIPVFSSPKKNNDIYESIDGPLEPPPPLPSVDKLKNHIRHQKYHVVKNAQLSPTRSPKRGMLNAENFVSPT